MYTYKSFETLGAFTLLRPILITFLVISLILFLTVIIKKTNNKLNNGFTVISISIISVLVSAQILFYGGIIADEINLGGDVASTYMFIAILIVSILNIIIFFARNPK